MSSTPLYIEVTPRNWEQAKSIARKLRLSIFRGHSNSRWPLTTTIGRAAKQFNSPEKNLWQQEKKMLRRFKSRAHHYIPSPPEENNSIEWLSQIQDYGGPTRLLDFTESFYIASFFAMENATEDACVWAINSYQLFDNLKRFTDYEIDKPGSYSQETISSLAETFLENETKSQNLILQITPSRLNERLAVQKGTFLFPCNIGNDFESNLCATFGFDFSNLESNNAIQLDLEKDKVRSLPVRAEIVKINLPKEQFLHLDAIRDLHSMNIDAASLFPGLDGFARSLKYVVRINERV